MSNRINRGKQPSNQNPKFVPTNNAGPPRSTNTNTKPGTSSSSSRQQILPRKNKGSNKKKVTRSIWVVKKETRNWLELPRDVVLHIFLKLSLIDLLYRTQSVCSSWREIARDPLLYRRIDLTNPWPHFSDGDTAPLVKMAIQAINRSCRQLVDFSINYAATDEMLRLMPEASSGLKRLRLMNCHLISEEAFVEAVGKMPCLEEVELSMRSVMTPKTIEAVGRACPGLKLFRLNQRRRLSPSDLDDQALAIATTMPGLQSLNLFGNSMTDIGLEAILNKCLHLEYLDCRQCFNVELGGDLLNKCQQIKRVRFPNDSIEYYDFEATLDGDYESDFSYDADFASDLSYEDYTDPFNPIYWSDDEDYRFIFGKDSDDDFDLGNQLLYKAFIPDGDSSDFEY